MIYWSYLLIYWYSFQSMKSKLWIFASILAIYQVKKRTEWLLLCPLIEFFTARTSRSRSLSPSECSAPRSSERSREDVIVDVEWAICSSWWLKYIVRYGLGSSVVSAIRAIVFAHRSSVFKLLHWFFIFANLSRI